MARENFTMPSSRGDEELNCYRWMPEGNPKASLQIVHGMTEHILRYEDFATFLNSNGFAVYGHDHLGHGGTSEEKGFIAEEHGDDMLVEDMRKVNDRMRSDLPGIPHFVMGHSMGSFVTRRFLTVGGNDVDAAVIMGTGQQAGYQVTLALTIAKLLCMVRGNHHRSGLLTCCAPCATLAVSTGGRVPERRFLWTAQESARTVPEENTGTKRNIRI